MESALFPQFPQEMSFNWLSIPHFGHFTEGGGGVGFRGATRKAYNPAAPIISTANQTNARSISFSLAAYPSKRGRLAMEDP